jgi:COPII coat assembly protein SEC16
MYTKYVHSPQIDTAVRATLLPGGETASESSADKLNAQPLSTSRSGFDLTSSSYGALAPASYDSANIKLADHTLWSSQLDKIEGFLARGDRHGAYHYAADEKLWAHAMIIASSIDKESWKEVVTEFVRSDLSSTATSSASSGKTTTADNRAPLRVAYSLFAGQGASCGTLNQFQVHVLCLMCYCSARASPS